MIYSRMINYEEERPKETRPGHATSRKGCMRGKGGPENASCTYKGVRQRTWGKWVAEIRESNNGARLWLGTFDTSYEAAMAYDAAARKLYGREAKLNLPELAARFPPSSGSFQGPKQSYPSQNYFYGADTEIVFMENTVQFYGEIKTYSFPKYLLDDLPEFDDSAMWEEAFASMENYQALADPGIFADEYYGDNLKLPWE